MKTINQEILDIATKYVGQEEIRGNLGFKDERFQELMEIVGWQRTHAWCAYFTELVWTLAYGNQNSIIQAELEKLFSGSAVKTLSNFQKAKDWTVSKNPVIGSVAIWQKFNNANPHWSGHAGIVIDRTEMGFTCVEGNTNSKGGREGYEVAIKDRIYNFGSANGLVLRGFIIPKQP